MQTKFLLDSGDPDEYRAIASLAKEKREELWGATTNPSLIAKKLAGKKFSKEALFGLQKDIVLEIVQIVPGAVSAEVYADEKTTGEEMIAQGKEIATWHERVVVKLPTTIEGFKARTALRQENILTNNTLVFSQEQIFAICLHEKIMCESGTTEGAWPPFISPFVGRLDDIGQNGMDLIRHGMQIKAVFTNPLWMLEASIRSTMHISEGMDLSVESMTAPAKAYEAYFAKEQTQAPRQAFTPIPLWEPSEELQAIKTIDAFMDALTSGSLNIQHDLTGKGIIRFAADWNALITN